MRPLSRLIGPIGPIGPRGGIPPPGRGGGPPPGGGGGGEPPGGGAPGAGDERPSSRWCRAERTTPHSASPPSPHAARPSSSARGHTSLCRRPIRRGSLCRSTLARRSSGAVRNGALGREGCGGEWRERKVSSLVSLTHFFSIRHTPILFITSCVHLSHTHLSPPILSRAHFLVFF